MRGALSIFIGCYLINSSKIAPLSLNLRVNPYCEVFNSIIRKWEKKNTLTLAIKIILREYWDNIKIILR